MSKGSSSVENPIGQLQSIFKECHGDILDEIRATVEGFIYIARSLAIHQIVVSAQPSALKFCCERPTSCSTVDFLLSLHLPSDARDILIKVKDFFDGSLGGKPLCRGSGTLKLQHRSLGTVYLPKDMTDRLWEANILCRRISLWSLEIVRNREEAKSISKLRKSIVALVDSNFHDADIETQPLRLITTLRYIEDSFSFKQEECHHSIGHIIMLLKDSLIKLERTQHELISSEQSLHDKNVHKLACELKFRDLLLADAKAEEDSLDLPIEYYLRGNKALKRAFDARSLAREALKAAATLVERNTSSVALLLSNFRLVSLMTGRMIRIAMMVIDDKKPATGKTRDFDNICPSNEHMREFLTAAFAGFPWSQLHDIAILEHLVFDASAVHVLCCALCKVSNTFQLQMADEGQGDSDSEGNAPILLTALRELVRQKEKLKPAAKKGGVQETKENISANISGALAYWATYNNRHVAMRVANWYEEEKAGSSLYDDDGGLSLSLQPQEAVRTAPLWMSATLLLTAHHHQQQQTSFGDDGKLQCEDQEQQVGSENSSYFDQQNAVTSDDRFSRGIIVSGGDHIQGERASSRGINNDIENPLRVLSTGIPAAVKGAGTARSTTPMMKSSSTPVSKQQESSSVVSYLEELSASRESLSWGQFTDTRSAVAATVRRYLDIKYAETQPASPSGTTVSRSTTATGNGDVVRREGNDWLVRFEESYSNPPLCCMNIAHLLVYCGSNTIRIINEELNHLSIREEEDSHCEKELEPLHRITWVDWLSNILTQDRYDVVRKRFLELSPGNYELLLDACSSTASETMHELTVFMKSLEVRRGMKTDATTTSSSNTNSDFAWSDLAIGPIDLRILSHSIIARVVRLNSLLRLLTALLTGSKISYRHPSDDEKGLSLDYQSAVWCHIKMHCLPALVDTVLHVCAFIYHCPHPIVAIGTGVENWSLLSVALQFLSAVGYGAPDIAVRGLTESCSQNAIWRNAEARDLTESDSRFLVPFLLVMEGSVEGLIEFYVKSNHWKVFPTVREILGEFTQEDGGSTRAQKGSAEADLEPFWSILSSTTTASQASFVELLNVMSDVSASVDDGSAERSIRLRFCKIVLAQGNAIAYIIRSCMDTCVPLPFPSGDLQPRFTVRAMARGPNGAQEKEIPKALDSQLFTDRLVLLAQLMQLTINLIEHDDSDQDHEAISTAAAAPMTATATGTSTFRGFGQGSGKPTISREEIMTLFSSKDPTKRPFSYTTLQFRIAFGKYGGCEVASHALAVATAYLPPIISPLAAFAMQSNKFRSAVFSSSQADRVIQWSTGSLSRVDLGPHGQDGEGEQHEEEFVDAEEGDADHSWVSHCANWISENCFQRSRTLRDVSLTAMNLLIAVSLRQIDLQNMVAERYPYVFNDIGLSLKRVVMMLLPEDEQGGGGGCNLNDHHHMYDDDEDFTMSIDDLDDDPDRAFELALRRLRYHHHVSAAAARLASALAHRSPACQTLVLSSGIVEGLFESLDQLPQRFIKEEYLSLVARDVPLAVDRLCSYKECSAQVMRIASIVGLLKLCVLGSETIRLMACTAMVNNTTANLEEVIGDLSNTASASTGASFLLEHSMASLDIADDGLATTITSTNIQQEQQEQEQHQQVSTESKREDEKVDGERDGSLELEGLHDDDIAGSDEAAVSEAVVAAAAVVKRRLHPAHAYIIDAVHSSAHEVVLNVLEVAGEKEQQAALQLFKNLLWSRIVRDSAIVERNLQLLTKFLFSQNSELIRLVCEILLVLCLHNRVALCSALSNIARDPSARHEYGGHSTSNSSGRGRGGDNNVLTTRSNTIRFNSQFSYRSYDCGGGGRGGEGHGQFPLSPTRKEEEKTSHHYRAEVGGGGGGGRSLTRQLSTASGDITRSNIAAADGRGGAGIAEPVRAASKSSKELFSKSLPGRLGLVLPAISSSPVKRGGGERGGGYAVAAALARSASGSMQKNDTTTLLLDRTGTDLDDDEFALYDTFNRLDVVRRLHEISSGGDLRRFDAEGLPSLSMTATGTGTGTLAPPARSAAAQAQGAGRSLTSSERLPTRTVGGLSASQMERELSIARDQNRAVAHIAAAVIAGLTDSGQNVRDGSAPLRGTLITSGILPSIHC